MHVKESSTEAFMTLHIIISCEGDSPVLTLLAAHHLICPASGPQVYMRERGREGERERGREEERERGREGERERGREGGRKRGREEEREGERE